MNMEGSHTGRSGNMYTPIKGQHEQKGAVPLTLCLLACFSCWLSCTSQRLSLKFKNSGSTGFVICMLSMKSILRHLTALILDVALLSKLTKDILCVPLIMAQVRPLSCILGAVIRVLLYI